MYEYPAVNNFSFNKLLESVHSDKIVYFLHRCCILKASSTVIYVIKTKNKYKRYSDLAIFVPYLPASFVEFYLANLQGYERLFEALCDTFKVHKPFAFSVQRCVTEDEDPNIS
jgi:hypothetical protein